MSKKPGAGSAGAADSAGPWDEFQRKASEAWQDWARQSIPAPPDAAPETDWAERIRAGLDGYTPGWVSWGRRRVPGLRRRRPREHRRVWMGLSLGGLGSRPCSAVISRPCRLC